MKGRRLHWTMGLLAAAFLTSCGKQIPKEIIQPDHMEKILYDYHVSLSMGNKLSYNDRYQNEAYRNYVFHKHGISEAEFDSSMVWYTRHTEELATLYKRVGERLRSDKKHLQHLLVLRENKPVTTEYGDTVDIWYDRKLYWMTNAPLAHRINFEIPADSNFHVRDRFVWSADYHFLGSGKSLATMGFNVLFDNDSVIGKVIHITQSGPQQLTLQSDSAYKIKKVSGFIYYSSDASAVAALKKPDSLVTDSVKPDSLTVLSSAHVMAAGDPGLIVNGLNLIRYHLPAVDSTAIDSVAVDSFLVDTLLSKEGGKVRESNSSSPADEPKRPKDRIKRTSDR